MRRYLQQRLKFRHLRVIDAIITHESILQAAKALGLSQPALTKSLQEIEEIVGARLFDRHARGVDPTPFGLTVAASARRLLSEISRLEDDLDALEGGDGGPVIVGALPVAAAGVLPGALARLKIARPDIEVRVTQGRTEELISLLTLREIDLIIGQLYPMPEDDGLIRTPFYSEPISVLARSDHPIFAEGLDTATALTRYPLVLPTVSQRVGREIDGLLAEMAVEPRQPLRSSSAAMIREILYATDNVAVMPHMLLAGDLLRGAVRLLPLDIPQRARPAGLIRRGDTQLLRNAQAFVDAARGYVGEIENRLANRL
ncbi:LysR substrate-binding domain-containing protein [Caulobacter sp. UNC358MFTsu5.1]|uniref:LysR substrate-binding domain-containing protein n=1 Tax=Caulobacter sp. UNC358MFTsu5.1 TaxID=1449049 RepID=UPI000689DEB7|nr:LysR substrate-binding domain-containing protein [Caulobacter sp. UNC358MFTsu5.1]